MTSQSRPKKVVVCAARISARLSSFANDRRSHMSRRYCRMGGRPTLCGSKTRTSVEAIRVDDGVVEVDDAKTASWARRGATTVRDGIAPSYGRLRRSPALRAWRRG